jgi:hypothetical protein
MKRNILITGGTGLVGKCLSQYLLEQGYQVAHLSRSLQSRDYKTFLWNYKEGKIDNKAIEFADVIIHLAGENISNARWTKQQKQVIIDSRVKTTLLLKSAIDSAQKKPELFISASAIGYYGTFNSEEIFTEDSPAGNDFLADVVMQWESAVDEIEASGLSIVKLRTGVVLDKDKGAFPKIIKPIKMGLASVLGSGKQYMPWISNTDLARIYAFVIENNLKNSNEVYNAVSPEFINNKQMTKVLAKALKKPMFLPAIPEFIFKIMFGEMSSILLYGSRVSSEKLSKSGFKFEYSSIKDWFIN